MDLLHRKAQNYKVSNKNNLFCAWRDFYKTSCGISTYHKWMFKLQISTIFNFDWAHQSWISGVLGVKKAKKVEKDKFDSAAWNSSTLKTLTEAFCSLTVVQWKLLIAVGGLSDANGSMELWDTSNNIIREIEYVNGTMDTSQVSKFFIWQTPYPSALDFWKIKFEKSSSTNWIFTVHR